MSRWTGDKHMGAVLAAAGAWRERCFLKDGSLFGEESIWTLAVSSRLETSALLENPIEGADRTFFDKAERTIEGCTSTRSLQLAAELVWFLLLFPIYSSTKPETKRAQIYWTCGVGPRPNFPDKPYT